MQVNVLEPIKTLDTSEDKKYFKDQNGLPFLVGNAAIQAILAESPGAPSSAQDKFAAYQLAMKIDAAVKGNHEHLDLSVEEVALIKKKAAVFPPLLMGRLYDSLEGKAQ